MMTLRLPTATLAALRARALPPPPPFHCCPPHAVSTPERLHREAVPKAKRLRNEPSPSGWEAEAIGGDDAQLLHSVRQLLESGRPAVAAHLLQEEWAFNKRCLSDPALSKELILQLIRQQNTAAALEVLPFVTTTPNLCAAAIRAATERRSLRGVHALLYHARSTGVTEGLEGREVWRAAIVAFGKLGRSEDAREAFVGMRAAGAWDVQDTFSVNLLLNALASDISVQFIRCNQLRKEGVVPDASTYNTLLKACMGPRDVRRADLALTWMKEDGAKPDSVTYNTLIKIFSYAKDFERVLAVWRQMAAAGFAPTARLWGSVLMACSAAGQMEQAAIFWWEMKELHIQGGGGVLTTDNVCAMMTACNDAGQYERALTVLEEAKGLGVAMDTRAYNIALRACHTPGKTMRQEQLLQAFGLYEELKQRKLPPDAFTFGTLFALCAAARQGRCAMQLYEEMLELGVQENVVSMTALIKAVGSTPGMAPECLHLFKRMSYGPARVKPNQGTFRTVITALREQGELAEALRVYQGMRRQYPADNSEFEGLTAVAAERAFSCEDADLRSVVAAVCHITSSRSVDLHGMSVLEARAAVLCILAMLLQQYRDSGTIGHDVTIVTGRGKGSRGGPAVIRSEVARLLQALFLEVPPHAPGDNAGRIVIPQQLLCQAMERKTALRAAQSKLQLPPPQSLLHLHPRYQQHWQQQGKQEQQQEQEDSPLSPDAGS